MDLECAQRITASLLWELQVILYASPTRSSPIKYETHRCNGSSCRLRTCQRSSKTSCNPIMEVMARNLARARCAVWAAISSLVFSRGTLSAICATERIDANAFSLNGNDSGSTRAARRREASQEDRDFRGV